MARTDFYRLSVAKVESLTADSAAVQFRVPAELADEFRFAPGQSLTVRRGQERRTYSICAPAGQALRIGVREVAGGQLSPWLVHQLRPGDVVQVQRPSGSFTPDLITAGRHLLIAAGSGITPMLSIAASVLAARIESTVTLIYGNRRSSSVMFADEVADLKDAYPNRMQLFHVLSREPQEVELFSGRLDAARLRRLLTGVVDVGSVDHVWLCGPLGLVGDAIEVLTAAGVPAERIHRELFYVGDMAPAPVRVVDPAPGPGATVTVILDGRTSTMAVPPDVAVLDAAQAVRPDLPFACRGGVCGTCRAKVTAGTVDMRRNFALEPAEVAAGYVLTCQARPTSDTVTVDYDS